MKPLSKRKYSTTTEYLSYSIWPRFGRPWSGLSNLAITICLIFMSDRKTAMWLGRRIAVIQCHPHSTDGCQFLKHSPSDSRKRFDQGCALDAEVAAHSGLGHAAIQRGKYGKYGIPFPSNDCRWTSADSSTSFSGG